MILYETNIPHVYCIYEGVTINAINVNGEALLEDNSLLDEDCFYTVIDVIDENAHARKLVVKGIKKMAAKAEPKTIRFDTKKELADKLFDTITPHEKRILIRHFKKYNKGKPSIPRVKKDYINSIPKNSLGLVDERIPNVKTVKKIYKDGHLIDYDAMRDISDHEGRHLLQNQDIIRKYGIQSLRKVHNNKKLIQFKKATGENAKSKNTMRRYSHDPLEYDAHVTGKNLEYLRMRAKQNPVWSKDLHDELHPGYVGKKDLMRDIRKLKSKNKYAKKSINDRISDSQYQNSSGRRLAISSYAATHPKFLKRFSKTHSSSYLPRSLAD